MAARLAVILGSAGIGIPSVARGGEVDTLLFGSLDAGAASFLSVGAKIAFDNLARPGFAVMVIGGGGRRVEAGCVCDRIAGTARLSRYTAAGAALIGYQWFPEWGVVGLYTGPEGTAEALTDGSSMATLPMRWGFRLQAEIWARPTEQTLVHATLVAGSARDSVWSRIGLGYRAWSVYLGPEASLYADRTGYTKWNFGLHATDFALGGYKFRLSGGVQIADDARRPSPYVALSAWTPW